MDKVTCPDCGEECEINHDDGAFYTEDELEEMQCEHCDKYFMVSTSMSFYHEGHKTPCLNGEEHDWKEICGYPKEVYDGKKRCSYCGEEKDFLSKEERAEKIKEYREKLDKKD